MGNAMGGVSEAIDADDISSERQDIPLVFPFLGADNIVKATIGHPLCNTGDDFTCSQLISYQLEKSVGRNSIQTLTEFDCDTLKEKNFLNDIIIDFWMLWLSHNCRQGKSSEHFFTSHFYTKLIEESGGMESISTWVLRRTNFCLFEKHISYFPIVFE
jgi:Ulp1 family protease